jgi:hypothetical protein
MFRIAITRAKFIGSDPVYPTRADFDQAFGESATDGDSESINAKRETIRRAG